jgi:hypothetical protein
MTVAINQGPGMVWTLVGISVLIAIRRAVAR